jgi:hypothetical protein
MAEPATQPNSSFSHVKPRKIKTPKEKSQRQHQRQNQVAVSSDAVGATTGPTSAAAAVSPAATPKDGGVLLADYDVEFGDFDYDAVKADEGTELWLVRAPTSVRPFLSLFPSSGGPFFFLAFFFDNLCFSL